MFQMRMQSLKSYAYSALFRSNTGHSNAKANPLFWGCALYPLFYIYVSFNVFFYSLSLKHASGDVCHLLIIFASSFLSTANLKMFSRTEINSVSNSLDANQA